MVDEIDERDVAIILDMVDELAEEADRAPTFDAAKPDQVIWWNFEWDATGTRLAAYQRLRARFPRRSGVGED